MKNNSLNPSYFDRAGNFLSAAVENLGKASIIAIKAAGTGISRLGSNLDKPLKKTPDTVGNFFLSTLSAVRTGSANLFNSVRCLNFTNSKQKRQIFKSSEIAELKTVIETLISEKQLMARQTAILEKRLQDIEKRLQPMFDTDQKHKPEINELKKDLKDISESLKT